MGLYSNEKSLTWSENRDKPVETCDNRRDYYIIKPREHTKLSNWINFLSIQMNWGDGTNPLIGVGWHQTPATKPSHHLTEASLSGTWQQGKWHLPQYDVA